MKPLAVIAAATGGIGSAITRRLAHGHRVVGRRRITQGQIAGQGRAGAGPHAERVLVLASQQAASGVNGGLGIG